MSEKIATKPSLGARIWNYLSWILILAMLPLLWARIQSSQSLSSMEDRPAPEIQLQNINGNTLVFPLSLQAKLLVFWATWCGPCQIEVSRLQSLVESNKIQQEQVLLVSQESAEVLQKFKIAKNLPFELFTDRTGSAFTKYQVQATPTLFLVDNKGTVQWATTGLSPFLSWRLTRTLNP